MNNNVGERIKAARLKLGLTQFRNKKEPLATVEIARGFKWWSARGSNPRQPGCDPYIVWLYN